MTIDFHSHDFPDAIATRALAGLCGRTDGTLWPVGDGTLANHLDHMDCAGVDMAVLCPVATKPGQFDVILRTAVAIRDGELGERAARKIVPFASVHPADPRLFEHLDAVAKAGIKGVKLHPYYQDFSLADPSVWPMFSKIADLGLVVQCHAGFDIGYPTRADACMPADIAALLRNVRGLKFVAAHLGGCAGARPHATDEILELGAYIDTSALHRDWHRDEQMRLLRSWPKDRILFGTDFPWVHYPEALRWVRSVRAPEDIPALLGGNAARLLGLGGDARW
ncbi:MAG: amidohydrolase family protein [Kiritimatiellae bacterium]|nr:amidohydrolase family protein [Kiritimatiellia bacterium]